ncbi:hypothetical protein PRECH8_25990 [Insulibacter thermoxylanivorax]|uniref:Cthe-2314-like HEPN domain-containing protein n=1 Tax=Insulibacter thermoxylanivorax TaxID=2749268 RepID=A0A916QHY0_9BACL|nr:Cthe_2314 family HEPN domain-containing protein [Insulibacter thermoxylanivorax]GFR39303.1 hypothetical protein PRECH8_25990 [Insulibacter thermoxylanivorax]
MLRRLLGEPSAEQSEQFRKIFHLIDRYCGQLRASIPDGMEEHASIYRLEAWARGFKDSLNELEQSQYAAAWFSKRVHKQFEEEMDAGELADYRLHVYFYKNAIVRVFSILDKLGYFMNELYMLRTERVKPRYSFFTVLRQMRTEPSVQDLYDRLQKIKAAYQEPLNVLRKKRNLEIHYVNVEMLDDLHQTKKHFTKLNGIEDLEQSMAVLAQGCEMVYQTMTTIFEVSYQRIAHSGMSS